MPTRKRRLSKDAPYHTERLWALIREVRDDLARTRTTEMMYLLAPTRKELWESVVGLEFYGTNQTKASLQEAGWVAREVFVEERAV
jgi:hypothetical protein